MQMQTSLDYGWRGRWIAWRNRVLASPGFQRFAARCMLTRPVARRRARALFDLVAGFTYSQILAACVETRLLDVLAEGPLDTAAIAARCALPDDGALRLLRGAAALRLVEPLGQIEKLFHIRPPLRATRTRLQPVAVKGFRQDFFKTLGE